MSYAPPSHAPMPSVMLSTLSPESLIRRVPNAAVGASAAWSTTNRIIYVPFQINRPVIVYKLWWLNGTTATTNNFQAGVYTSAFGRVIAGNSVLAAGASVCQYDDIADTGLPAGRYFMALWGSGTTATTARFSGSGGVGVYYETNASGLPSTGTPAATASNTPQIPIFGLKLRSSP